MAKLKVYVVFDSKVSAFMNPFQARTAGEGLRMWEQAVNDPKTQFHAYPEDFALFEIAEYDEQTGRYSQYETLKSLGTALELHKGRRGDAQVTELRRAALLPPVLDQGQAQ